MAKYFDWKTILILIILAIFVFRECSRPLPMDEGKQPYLDSIKVLKSQKAFKAAQFDSISSIADILVKEKDSLVAAKDREISRLKVKASQARTPKVDTLILDNPELKVFVEAQDSVILTQSVLIDTLKAQVEFERMTREQLTSLHYDQAKIESQMSELKDQRIIDLEKSLKKERRRGRFAKVLIPIVGVAGLLLGSNL